MLITSADIRRINREFRSRDESHLWPTCGRYNVTERAIRRVRRMVARGLVIDDPYSYEAILEQQISAIVNNY